MKYFVIPSPPATALAFLFCWLMSSFATAQTTPLFSELNLTPAGLTEVQHAKYDKLMALAGVETAYFIQMAPLANVQVGAKLLVKTPGHTCSNMVYYAKELNFTSDITYTWTGDLYNLCDTCPCNEGYLSFSKTATGYFGHLVVDGTEYQLRDLGGNVQLLLKFNLAEMPGGNCGLTRITPKPVDPPMTNPGGCTVRLLVLYDFYANVQDPDIVETIKQAVQDFKATRWNSGINNYLLNINHVGTVSFDLPTINIADPQMDLNQLLSNQTVIQLRNDPAYRADLVILVTGRNYFNADGGDLAGISRMDDVNDNLDWALIPDHGFAIIEASTMIARNVLAHEAGHLFAAGHQRPIGATTAPDPRPGIPHGYRFVTKKGLQFGTPGGWIIKAKFNSTVMYTEIEDAPRIMYYSNPKIKYKGFETGESGISNNALVLINGACTVANYLSGPDNQLIATITGDNWGCPDATECLGVHIQGPPPPYQVQWHQSTDGITWSNASSSGSYCVTVPATVGDRIFVRVQVSSGTTTVTDYHEIEASQGQNGISCALRPAPPGAIALTQDGVYPNPSYDGRFHLGLPATASGELEVDILDVAQRNVGHSVQVVVAGIPPVLDFSGLPAGTYFVYTSLAGAAPQVHKIFILK